MASSSAIGRIILHAVGEGILLPFTQGQAAAQVDPI